MKKLKLLIGIMLLSLSLKWILELGYFIYFLGSTTDTIL